MLHCNLLSPLDIVALSSPITYLTGFQCGHAEYFTGAKCPNLATLNLGFGDDMSRITRPEICILDSSNVFSPASNLPKKMKVSYLGIFLLFFLSFTVSGQSPTSPKDAVMQALKVSLGNSTSLGWSGPDPCQWSNVMCSPNNRVTHIQISNRNLQGSLPLDIRNLSSLKVLEVANNQLTGPIPSLFGLSSLQKLAFDNNFFSYMPADFFTGLMSLQSISLDHNPLYSWEVPESLKDAIGLQNFSANQAGISGIIPDFMGGDTFPGLMNLHLAMNNLQGQIPPSFGKSSIRTLWLNGQRSNTKLNGSLSVVQNMTSLTQIWLNDNLFTGPLPDLSGLSSLEDLNLRDNQLTGIVPLSLINLPKLNSVNLTNNLLQGPTPRFNISKIKVDMRTGSNSFCLDDPGVACNSQVNFLLSIAESIGFPMVFAQSWKGNNPCGNSQKWKGISCDLGGNITAINFQNLGLLGTISSNFSRLLSLRYLILANNTLSGTLPYELTTLSSLKKLDISNNHLCGTLPVFRQNVLVITDGNPGIGKNCSSFPPQGAPSGTDKGGNGFLSHRSKNSNNWKIVGSVIGAVGSVLTIVLGICLFTRKRSTVMIHPRHSGYGNAMKNPDSRSSVNEGESKTHSHTRNRPSDIQVFESGNTVIPIQVLKNATNNFSKQNVLGRGGFGTVYKGESQDGTKIAVKRMEPGGLSQQGLTEFQSEIAVLTKVRHRHLVSLLGYCLDVNERLLVYEFMPQGTLSRHLFNWKEEGWKPLEWTQRLTIALDVARGVEYLHGLAHQSFIHRDLKPSNILLGDDMRAKVADFGLVRLVPDNGNHSIETRIAGTFGYLAQEYVETGRVTTKVDVFSFGVILMELITGKKAIDATVSDPDQNTMHLTTWFRRMHTNEDTFQEAIDQTIELDEEALASVSTVAKLAGHCCASNPYQRPNMSHVVNVLSSIAEVWKPAEPDSDGIYGIELDMYLTTKANISTQKQTVSPVAKVEELHCSF